MKINCQRNYFIYIFIFIYKKNVFLMASPKRKLQSLRTPRQQDMTMPLSLTSRNHPPQREDGSTAVIIKEWFDLWQFTFEFNKYWLIHPNFIVIVTLQTFKYKGPWLHSRQIQRQNNFQFEKRQSSLKIFMLLKSSNP